MVPPQTRSVLSCEVLVQVVLSVLGSPASLEKLVRREPYVSLYATAAQGAHAAAVVAHKQLCPGLLRRRSLGVDHSGNNDRPLLFELTCRLVKYLFHWFTLCPKPAVKALA